VAQDPDLVVTGEAETFLAVASGRLDLEEAMESGSLRVEGDREVLLASANNKS
jgi:putative sterol carrier protein